jgi:predicted nuclease of restriction endonuclease-like (RecB) superfamily
MKLLNVENCHADTFYKIQTSKYSYSKSSLRPLNIHFQLSNRNLVSRKCEVCLILSLAPFMANTENMLLIFQISNT